MSGHLQPTTVTLDAGDVVADVDPRLFGGLMEHMGRCVYEGVYEPTSAHADEHGCRTDVLDALRELDLTAIRYPGGNFVSGYDWRDGIGPQAERPEPALILRGAGQACPRLRRGGHAAAAACGCRTVPSRRLRAPPGCRGATAS